MLGGPRPAMVSGPGYKRLDLSFLKDFQLNERFRLQFRTEITDQSPPSVVDNPGTGGKVQIGLPLTDFSPILRLLLTKQALLVIFEAGPPGMFAIVHPLPS